MTGTEKSVSRTYGGVLCGPCVRSKIVRAFLIEEQRIVKRVLKTAQANEAKKAKADAAKAKKGSKKVVKK